MLMSAGQPRHLPGERASDLIFHNPLILFLFWNLLGRPANQAMNYEHRLTCLYAHGVFGQHSVQWPFHDFTRLFIHMYKGVYVCYSHRRKFQN